MVTKTRTSKVTDHVRYLGPFCFWSEDDDRRVNPGQQTAMQQRVDEFVSSAGIAEVVRIEHLCMKHVYGAHEGMKVLVAVHYRI